MKYIYYFLGLLIISSIVACDDDLNSVGSGIQPGGDGIAVKTDTFDMQLKTVLVDSIYAWSTASLLGEYEDEIFGTIKSDYLSEFYCPNGITFLGDSIDKTNTVKIDSVQISINYIEFNGDTISPMGASIYKVTTNLTNNFYTNVDPKKYCDMQNMLGQQTYSIAGSKRYSNGMRSVVVDLPSKVGEDFYHELLNNPSTFNNSASFKKFFPGIYVTTNFGKNSLIQVEYTTLNIYCSSKYKKTYEDIHGNDSIAVRDTTSVVYFATTDVIQLNRVKNSIPQNLLTDTESAYIKAPAGVYAEVVLPILDIKNTLNNDTTRTISAANVSFYGNTIKEDYLEIGSSLKFQRPNKLLFIDSDSVETFFRNKKSIDYKTRVLLERNTRNVYNIGNIASIVSEYKNRKDLTKNPRFLLIPVLQSTDGTIYNYMKPMTAAIKKDEESLKMGVITVKY